MPHAEGAWFFSISLSDIITGQVTLPVLLKTKNMAFSELIVLSLWYSDRHVSVKDLYIFHFNLKQLTNPHESLAKPTKHKTKKPERLCKSASGPPQGRNQFNKYVYRNRIFGIFLVLLTISYNPPRLRLQYRTEYQFSSNALQT